jgi:uncharacterized protein (TIGR00375 family)
MINFEEVLFGDFHIHSRYSRACSTNISFENLVKWAKIKGLNILGTGDFTHPLWIKEIKEKLIEKNGFYYYEDFPFIITGEISFIYTKGKGRRIHLNVLVPSVEVADKINSYLDTLGRRDYDGRPIFGISCEDFVREMKKISEDIEIIPAHIWTPYFGVFGSKSGFDSLKEAFGKEFENIHAIETGISSDPEMNWRIAELENKSIVSFSDAHSFWPFRLGREATIFRKVNSYKEIVKQIRENNFIGTIETEPAYGKYHFDGHAKCNFSSSPEETKKLNGICPVCKKPLTIGVENRVEQLANYEKGFKPKNAKIYYKILPLHEIISLFFEKAMESKTVWNLYNSFIENFGNEFNILFNVSEKEFLEKKVNPKLIELILKNREEKIKVKPGYDGEYGVAQIGEKQEKLF